MIISDYLSQLISFLLKRAVNTNHTMLWQVEKWVEKCSMLLAEIRSIFRNKISFNILHFIISHFMCF